MPQIALPEGRPGIGAGLAFCPETTDPAREPAHILLHEPGIPAAAGREPIAAYVSLRYSACVCRRICAGHRRLPATEAGRRGQG